MVRRQGLENPRGIVDRRVTKSVKVWKSPENLPRVIGRGLCDLSSRRIRWGLCVRDWVSSSLNTQSLQLDVQLRQQLELVYQIIVFTKLTGSISSTLSFPHYCVVCLFISVFEDFDWRLSQFPQFNFFRLFVFILCYPVITLSVLCDCLHSIMMTMLVFCYVYIWVLIPLLLVLR